MATLGARVHGRKNSDLYGIYRLDSSEKKMHGWLVQITRSGNHQRKYFSDLFWGGKQRSLAEARDFRDSLLRRSRLMSKAEYVSILRKSNRSGVAGVCRAIGETRTGAKAAYWIAFWPKEGGLRGSAKFSVSKHGEENAFSLAVEARENGLKSVVGPHINNRIHKVWLEEGRQIGHMDTSEGGSSAGAKGGRGGHPRRS